MKNFMLVLLFVSTAAQAVEKKTVYHCKNTQTQKLTVLTIYGNGSKIDFYGPQTRSSVKPNAVLDGRPAYYYNAPNYQGITLPVELMKGEATRGRVYQAGWDSSLTFDCYLK